ncbi:hypothetical protein TNCV_1693131 [Trichonephila clavipes]|nr:hypothetical protein TNCV_1693131 [Trichonephila clavipes]
MLWQSMMVENGIILDNSVDVAGSKVDVLKLLACKRCPIIKDVQCVHGRYGTSKGHSAIPFRKKEKCHRRQHNLTVCPEQQRQQCPKYEPEVNFYRNHGSPNHETPLLRVRNVTESAFRS